MKIVVAGAGSKGKNIIYNFIKIGHNVVAIDKSREALQAISEIANVEVIIGDVCNPETLEAADIENSAGFISVTSSDSANIIACSLAKKSFKAPITMALVKSDFITMNEHNELYFKENFFIDHILNPDEEIAQELYNLVRYNDIYDYAEMDGVTVLELKCTPRSDISNTPLKHLKNIFPDIDMKIISISRNNKMILFPNSNDVILENDIVYVATQKKDVDSVFEAFNVDPEPRNIAIVGVNHIIKCLLAELAGRNVTIIDSSKENLDTLSNPNVDMRLLDANPANTLHELGNIDTLISATPDEEQNVLLSLTARKNEINRVIALSSDKYSSLISPDGHGIIVDIKNSVFSKILDILCIDEYVTLRNAEVAIFEMDIPESSPHIGNSIFHIFDSNNVLPLFVKSGDQLLAIDHNYVVHSKDRLIVVMSLNELKRFGLQNIYI